MSSLFSGWWHLVSLCRTFVQDFRSLSGGGEAADADASHFAGFGQDLRTGISTFKSTLLMFWMSMVEI
jgi:hypothetical protein